MASVEDRHKVKCMPVLTKRVYIFTLCGILFMTAIATFYILTKLLASPPLPNLDNYSAIEHMQLAFENFFHETGHPHFMKEGRQDKAREKFDIFYSRLNLLVNDTPKSHAFMQNIEYVDIANKLKNSANSIDDANTWNPANEGFIQKMLEIRQLAAEMNNQAYVTQVEQYEETLRRLNTYRLIALLIHGATVVLLGVILYAGLRYRKVAAEYAEAIRLKNLFISEINHEIRTPIQSLLNAAIILSGKTVAKEDKVLVDAINNSTEKIMSKMQEFGDYSKLEIGTLGISSSKFVINDLLQDIIHGFTPLTKKKNLYFNVESKFPTNYEFIGDTQRIKQVLSILIGNAVKFTSHGGISLQVSIEKNGASTMLNFSITDTGVGIKKEDQQKIFEAFVQLNNEINHTGSGLGLTIAKQITKLLNGKISVKSVLGRGTQFNLRIPIK